MSSRQKEVLVKANTGTIELTLKQVHEGLPSLLAFGNQKIPNRLVAFRVGRFGDLLRPVYDGIEAQRNELVIKYGSPQEFATPDGKIETRNQVPAGVYPEFLKEFQEFCTETVTIEARQICMEDIPDEFLPTGNEMSMMIWAFTEPKQ